MPSAAWLEAEPARVPLLISSRISADALDTRLPNWSWTMTATGGSKTMPATTASGTASKASRAGAPATAIAETGTGARPSTAMDARRLAGARAAGSRRPADFASLIGARRVSARRCRRRSVRRRSPSRPRLAAPSSSVTRATMGSPQDLADRPGLPAAAHELQVGRRSAAGAGARLATAGPETEDQYHLSSETKATDTVLDEGGGSCGQGALLGCRLRKIDAASGKTPILLSGAGLKILWSGSRCNTGPQTRCVPAPHDRGFRPINPRAGVRHGYLAVPA